MPETTSPAIDPVANSVHAATYAHLPPAGETGDVSDKDITDADGEHLLDLCSGRDRDVLHEEHVEID